MKTYIFIFSILFNLVSAKLSAQLFETFDYLDGPLTQVSNGAWELWSPSTLDANVVNGTLVNSDQSAEYGTDVIRSFNGVLRERGQFATFGIDLNLQLAGSAAFVLSMSPASPPYSSGMNYGHSLSVVAVGIENTNNFRIYGVYFDEQFDDIYVSFGIYPMGQWHRVSGTLSRRLTEGYVDFSLSMNGQNTVSGTFSMDDPRGFNVAEIWDSQGQAPRDCFADNLYVQAVPEPATAVLFGSGLACLIRRHKKRQ